MSHNCIANTKITTREDFSYVCEATVLIPEVRLEPQEEYFSCIRDRPIMVFDLS